MQHLDEQVVCSVGLKFPVEDTLETFDRHLDYTRQSACKAIWESKIITLGFLDPIVKVTL